ncbi:hypothetical protein UB44_21635 [Burkholderiaceae bacterium 26]|nr:hypothetical protein UB44_21635 [Burkholderiaceae bacterium 26]
MDVQRQPNHARTFCGRRAFSTLGCGELELDEAMAIAKRYGIACIELRTVGGSVDLPSHLASRYRTPEAFGAAVAAMPARVTSLGTSMQLANNSEQSRAEFLAYVGWAEACGAETLRVFDGGMAADSSEIEAAVSTWRWWQSLKSAHGWNVDVVIETHDAFAVEANLLRLLDAIPDCKLLWDAHHTWRKGQSEPTRTWELVRDRVQHIHIKDSVADAACAAGYRYVLPGDGALPMKDLLAALYRDSYAGILSLEWERHWHPELPTLEQALDAADLHGWWPR